MVRRATAQALHETASYLLEPSLRLWLVRYVELMMWWWQLLGLVQILQLLLQLSCLVGHVKIVPDRYILTHARREHLNWVCPVVQGRARSNVKCERMMIVSLPRGLLIHMPALVSGLTRVLTGCWLSGRLPECRIEVTAMCVAWAF